MARKINFDPSPDQDEVEQARAAQPAPTRAARPLLGLDRPLRPTGALGAISSSLDGVNAKVKRAEEIEQKLIAGQAIVDLDTGLIDASFAPDRMAASEEQNAAFRELIREHGQQVPILVRPKPGEEGRFQVAFGHRRLRACRELGLKVRAVVRALTDEQLVVAQGQENSGRTDLTFIERARFAAQLEDRKFSREIIMAALNVDKAALSRLISVVRKVPTDVIEAIGPAPGFGRVRWQELMDLLDGPEMRWKARSVVGTESFAALDTDKRFEAVLAGLREKKVVRVQPESWSASDGVRAAKITKADDKLTLIFDDKTAPRFGDFVRRRLQALYDEYKAASGGS
ncbi:plasmid partitioning protein RepB [Terrarubrum flagellatum]|uniref:plasmid partitioning protein RepB n=1 Tax=Terrirubrum flagellatum TaxID=2895980 RepID=UPI003144D784